MAIFFSLVCFMKLRSDYKTLDMKLIKIHWNLSSNESNWIYFDSKLHNLTAAFLWKGKKIKIAIYLGALGMELHQAHAFASKSYFCGWIREIFVCVGIHVSWLIQNVFIDQFNFFFQFFRQTLIIHRERALKIW